MVGVGKKLYVFMPTVLNMCVLLLGWCKERRERRKKSGKRVRIENPQSSFPSLSANRICAWAFWRSYIRWGCDEWIKGWKPVLGTWSSRHDVFLFRAKMNRKKLCCFDIFIFVFRFLIDADDSRTTSLFLPHNELAVNESFCKHVFHPIELKTTHTRAKWQFKCCAKVEHDVKRRGKGENK